MSSAGHRILGIEVAHRNHRDAIAKGAVTPAERLDANDLFAEAWFFQMDSMKIGIRADQLDRLRSLLYSFL